MRKGIAAGIIALVLAAGAGADDIAATMRGIVEKNGDAVVHVKLAVKQTFSMGGLGSQSEESVEEITATVISPEGLMVTSLMQTDPGSMLASMFGGEEGFDTKSEVTSVKAMFGDAEIDAEIVLRDKDLDLAFLRPVKKPEEAVTFVDLAGEAKAELFDPVVALYRMGQVAQRAVSANEFRIGAVQERPRLTYILGEFNGSGTPVFLHSGACLGINVTRTLQGPSQGGMGMGAALSMFSGSGGMNMASIVIPGPEILEIAKQVPAYEGE